MNLFSGSRLPGTISYGRDFSNNSEFRVAGVPSIIGDTHTQNFGIAWSALFPKLPTVRASFSMGSSGASVSGLDEDSSSSTKNLNVNSDYKLAGFDLRGNFSHLSNHYETGSFLTGLPISNGGSSNSESVTAQHDLPLNGNIGLGWGHSNFTGNDGNEWSSSTYTAGVGFTPIQRLSVSQTFNYTSNLSAIIAQTLGTGTVQEPLRFGNGSDAIYLNTNATFRVLRGLSVSGYFNHREQSYDHRNYADSQYGGTLNYNYATPLFGVLYFGIGVVDTANKQGNQGMGLVANVGLNKRFGKWETSGDFNYSQNTQTLVSVATTSSYSYGAGLRRRFNQDTYWSSAFRGSRSGLVVVDGTNSTSESYSSSFGWRRYSVSGSYSQSSGTAVLGAGGVLTPAPLAPLITDDLLFFNARSYGVSASTIIGRRLTFSGGYVNVFGSSKQTLAGTRNTGERYNTRMEYRLRKFSIIGGFNRSMQDISTIPGGPRVVNSFYLSLTRWFNVF
jgi:hypothetical protein